MDLAVVGLVFDLDDTLFDFRDTFARVLDDFYEQHLRATIFRDALNATGLDRPEQVMFVGDNPVGDIDGAGRFGMRTAWVRRGRQFPANLEPPDRIVDSVLEVRRIVDARLNPETAR